MLFISGMPFKTKFIEVICGRALLQQGRQSGSWRGAQLLFVVVAGVGADVGRNFTRAITTLAYIVYLRYK